MRATKGPRQRLNSEINRPMTPEGKAQYYVLLSGLKPSWKSKDWSVEARISSSMSATGRTEAGAIANLLAKIRESGGEATPDRLKVWRATWRPIPEHMRSFEVAEG